MAVPKKRTSKSRRGKRRSHLALKAPNYAVSTMDNELTLPHRVSLESADAYVERRQKEKAAKKA